MAKLLKAEMANFSKNHFGVLQTSGGNTREVMGIVKDSISPFFEHFLNAKMYQLSNDSETTFFIFIDTGLVSKKGIKTGYLITCLRFYRDNLNSISILHLLKSPIAVTVKDKDLTVI